MEWDGWWGTRAHPCPEGGRPATRRPLQGCSTPTRRGTCSAQLLRAMTRYCLLNSSLPWQEGFCWAGAQGRDPGTTTPWGAAPSPPRTRGVAGTLFLGPDQQTGHLTKARHLFLKTGRSPGNRAAREEALPQMGKLGQKITP